MPFSSLLPWKQLHATSMGRVPVLSQGMNERLPWPAEMLGYSPCSCCWDTAQPEWPPLWYHLSNGTWWTEFWYPRVKYVTGVFFTLASVDWPACPTQTRPHSQGILYTTGTFSLRLSFSGQANWRLWVVSNTMLCLYSIPLMWLRLYRCKVRQITEAGSSQGSLTDGGHDKSVSSCRYSLTVILKSYNLSLQAPTHCILRRTRWCSWWKGVAKAGVKLAVCVSRFPANLVAQQATGSLANSKCQGTEGGHLSPFPWWA